MTSPAPRGGKHIILFSGAATYLEYAMRLRTFGGVLPMHSYTPFITQREETRMNSLIHAIFQVMSK